MMNINDTLDEPDEMRMGSLLSLLSPEALCVQAMVSIESTSKALPIKDKSTTRHHETKETKNLELID